MKILVSGSHGLVGRALLAFYQKAGHHVVPLIRGNGPVNSDVVYWDPTLGKGEIEAFEGFDLVIHLAGKNVASSLWTQKHKDQILVSRSRDTWLLSHLLSKTESPPKMLICASAVGIYGNRPKQRLTEESPPGTGFLASVCQRWEESTAALIPRGTRIAHCRFGVILSKKGGMLSCLLPLFCLGLGAILGDGNQKVSWIALQDVVGAIDHLVHVESLSGPVNFTTPEPVSNRELSVALAKAVHRPLLFRVPEKILKWTLKEMADEMFLASVAAYPEKLLDSGYQFVYPTLQEAFESLLNRSDTR